MNSNGSSEWCFITYILHKFVENDCLKRENQGLGRSQADRPKVEWNLARMIAKFSFKIEMNYKS